MKGPEIGECRHSLAHHEWARVRGLTLPHCGSPSCGKCPGEHPGAPVTRLDAPFPVYHMTRDMAAAAMEAIGHLRR